jgi:hypothetical protein
MEFLDINLTQDSSLSTGGYLKKTRLYTGFKNIFKNPLNKKTRVFCGKHFADRKNEGRNQTKTRVLEDSGNGFMLRTLD